MDILCVASRGRNIVNGKRKDYKGAPTSQRLEPNLFGKTNCLTTVQKDNLIFCLNPRTDQKQTYQQDRIYDTIGKAPALLAQSSGRLNIFNEINNESFLLRRLTPIEFERLQTVPDNYTSGVSNTQRYKMLGNGWTIDMICFIFSFAYKGKN